MTLHAPFVWFGAKSMIADTIWQRLGNPDHYVEPFFGSGAVLLARSDDHHWWSKMETINDADGMVSNFWRSTKYDPDTVVRYADFPSHEADLHANHLWLLSQKVGLVDHLIADREYFDAKVAGIWLWGMSIWIGAGFCAGTGPWLVKDGRFVKEATNGHGVIGHATRMPGVQRRMQRVGRSGINNLSDDVSPDDVCGSRTEYVGNAISRLSNRLRNVRVLCGDWERVVGPAISTGNDICAVFLDPPYDMAERDDRIYNFDTAGISANVRKWCLEHGDDPHYRIALCGYQGEHSMPDSWDIVRWKTGGGYANIGDGRGKANAERETVWFSPYCIEPAKMQQLDLFGGI